MKFIVCALVLVLAVTSACATSNVQQWQAYKLKYNKAYNSAETEYKRFKNFEHNLERAALLQARNPLAKFGVNEFSDMAPEEFKIRHSAESYYAMAQQMKASGKIPTLKNVTLKRPTGTAIDWRDYGAVTPIKNQGQCGGCWSFSTTGNIEGQWAIAGHGLTSLSEQLLVSCDTSDSGCQGGLPTNAFGWLLSSMSGQIVTEASYPYQSGSGYAPACAYNSGMTVGAVISTYMNLPGDEASMANWVYSYGPASIGVDAQTWQTYNGGIMTDCYGTSLDHAVLIIGFNLAASPPYWIIKNQWGTSWGEGGYIQLQYGTNQCGITMNPSSARV